MSECVVRMEMPESCKKCKNPLCLWLNDGDFITISAVQDFRKKNDDGFPDFCPIICQLPKGHGPLVDAEKLKEQSVHFCETEYTFDFDAVFIEDINEASTIVPAERREI